MSAFRKIKFKKFAKPSVITRETRNSSCACCSTPGEAVDCGCLQRRRQTSHRQTAPNAADEALPAAIDAIGRLLNCMPAIAIRTYKMLTPLRQVASNPNCPRPQGTQSSAHAYGTTANTNATTHPLAAAGTGPRRPYATPSGTATAVKPARILLTAGTRSLTNS